jgi:antitoxin (DNA-binding transcriptional repressor) of toxin-antitoxin stability system
MNAPRKRKTSAIGEKRVGVTAFKAQCLALIDEVARGKTGRVVLTKRNRPVAELRRLAAPARGFALWGALKDTVITPSETDLTAPTGEIWDAAKN